MYNCIKHETQKAVLMDVITKDFVKGVYYKENVTQLWIPKRYITKTKNEIIIDKKFKTMYLLQHNKKSFIIRNAYCYDFGLMD